jgi:SAM-dependent methyltransferase
MEIRQWLAGAAGRLFGVSRPPIEPAPPAPGRASYGEIAERDARMRGWNNLSTGEICPGFRVSAEDVVADIGCGDAGSARLCAALGARVIVADIDPETLVLAEELLAGVQPPAAFEAHLTDGRRLPIADAAASRVICTEVIEHVENPEAFMAELARIGRAGALYLLSCPDPNAEAIYKRIAHPSYFEPPNHIRILGHDAFAGLVESAGLVIERRLSRGFYGLVRWALFWGCPKLTGDMRHPLLDSWDQTWALLLDQENGPLVKNVFDDLLPQSQVIIARKP